MSVCIYVCIYVYEIIINNVMTTPMRYMLHIENYLDLHIAHERDTDSIHKQIL